MYIPSMHLFIYEYIRYLRYYYSWLYWNNLICIECYETKWLFMYLIFILNAVLCITVYMFHMFVYCSLEGITKKKKMMIGRI